MSTVAPPTSLRLTPRPYQYEAVVAPFLSAGIRTCTLRWRRCLLRH